MGKLNNWLVGAAILLALVLEGCMASRPLVLSPGECAVISETEQLITVGKDCDIRKVRR